LGLVEIEEEDKVRPGQAHLRSAGPGKGQGWVLLGGRVDDAAVVVAVANHGDSGGEEGGDCVSGRGVSMAKRIGRRGVRVDAYWV
jgi:hypothetical protein